MVIFPATYTEVDTRPREVSAGSGSENQKNKIVGGPGEETEENKVNTHSP